MKQNWRNLLVQCDYNAQSLLELLTEKDVEDKYTDMHSEGWLHVDAFIRGGYDFAMAAALSADDTVPGMTTIIYTATILRLD